MRSVLTSLFCLLSFAAFADSHETKRFAYVTYSNCDITGEEDADEAFEKYAAPAYKAAKEAGEIDGYGYMRHHTGGNWRRLTFHTASSVPAVLAATGKIGDRVDKNLGSRDDKFGEACHSHDDYVWEIGMGNVDDVAGKYGISVYMVCNMGRERRADELVEKVFGPRYDKELGPGKLKSWGWLKHQIGGEYRRLLAMTADSVDDLIGARSALIETFAGTSASREFTSICGSHQDYLWETVVDGR